MVFSVSSIVRLDRPGTWSWTVYAPSLNTSGSPCRRKAKICPRFITVFLQALGSMPYDMSSPQEGGFVQDVRNTGGCERLLKIQTQCELKLKSCQFTDTLHEMICVSLPVVALLSLIHFRKKGETGKKKTGLKLYLKTNAKSDDCL